MRLTTSVAIVAASAVIGLALGHHGHHSAGREPLPKVPPPGWTAVCDSRAIGDVCHTYPPGDRRWEPTAPLPPKNPMRLPSPEKGDGR